MGKVIKEKTLMWALILKVFVASFFINLCVILISKRFGLFIDKADTNKPQRFHNTPTPRSGGLGIFIAFMLPFLLIPFAKHLPFEWGVLLGGSIVFLSGILEDFNASLSPKVRLTLQCLGGGVFMFFSEIYLKDLGFGISLPAYIGIPFTLFAVVGIINAINIIDGFNGLASGIALMAICAIIFVSQERPEVITLSYFLLGAVGGFFVLNFPWGKIFLGDGGAYFLGFMLSAMLIYITQDSVGGGGKHKALSMVWNRTAHLPLLGGDFFHIQTHWETFCISARQKPLAPDSLLTSALPTKGFQPSHSPYFASNPSTLYDISYPTLSFSHNPRATHSSIYPDVFPHLSMPTLNPLSPWFGITLLIYPFWEVIFSIYRKRFIRKRSAMQPDGVHLHMLLYKRKLKSNPKTTLYLLCFNAPFMVLACVFSENSWILLLMSFVFVVMYLALYASLVRFDKRKQST